MAGTTAAWRATTAAARCADGCCGVFDDGQNDPCGPLGDFSVGFSLHPRDYDMSGPPIGMCPDCGTTGDRYHEALKRAHEHWIAAPALAA